MTWTPPWDQGVTWFTRRTVAPTELTVSLREVVDDHLRAINGSYEDDMVARYMWAATAAAEKQTERALAPQAWQLVLDQFPSGLIVLPRPPLIGVTSLTYYDTSNVQQTLSGSPEQFLTVTSGSTQKACLAPFEGESWPSTYTRPDAVTVTFQCGYEDFNDPELQLINAGILVMVGELYKQRSLSVQNVNNTMAQLALSHFWRPVY